MGWLPKNPNDDIIELTDSGPNAEPRFSTTIRVSGRTDAAGNDQLFDVTLGVDPDTDETVVVNVTLQTGPIGDGIGRCGQG
jgi:hypothetical protein